MGLARFFSKDNIGRLFGRNKAVPSATKDEVVDVVDASSSEALMKAAEDEFGLTEVHGVGFLSDFRVYSKIPAARWANADSGLRAGRVTNIVATNLMYNASNFGTLVPGTAGLYMPLASGNSVTVNVPTIGISEVSSGGTQLPVLTADVEVPEVEELAEAGAVPERALITPKQVLVELRRVPNTFSSLDLEKKLVMYRSILECVRSDAGNGIKNTIEDVHNRIKARVKYRDIAAVRNFFDRFQCTSDEAVAELLEKHTHLRIGPADDFIPEMPDDALEVMVQYTKRTVQVSGRKPVFYLIANEKDFKKKQEQRQKRDPILLVQAPFGFYWQILGAWDEEMKLLEEL